MEIKKRPLQSASTSDFTFEALQQIAPSAFVEVRGEDGQLTHKIDIEALQELIGEKITDEQEERFGFYWVGKQEAKKVAARPTRQTLRPVEEKSVNWDNTQNLYIEGDNLEVLKLLQRAYLGKVKMIYIDPPYNTGKNLIRIQIITIIGFGTFIFCKLDISSLEFPTTIHVTTITKGIERANIFKIMYIKAILFANKPANITMVMYVITNLTALLYSFI